MKTRKETKRKGQFFLIGGLLILMVFFIGLPKSDPLTYDPFNDIINAYSNIESELGRALTLSLNASSSIDTFKNFTAFVESRMTGRFIIFDALWVVSEGNASTITNVSVGNFLEAAANVTLNMTNDSGASEIKYLDVPKGGTNWTEFHTVTANFTLLIAYNDDYKEVGWQRDKANLYFMVNLTRGGNTKKENLNL